MRLPIIVAALLLLMTVAIPGSANTINIQNSSFETYSCDGHLFSVCQPQYWTINTSDPDPTHLYWAGGTYLPVVGTYAPNGMVDDPTTWGWDSLAPGGGSQVGWSNGSALTQTLADSVDASTRYVLSLWVSTRGTNYNFSPVIQLLAGSTPVIQMTLAHPGGALPTRESTADPFNWVLWTGTWTSPGSGTLLGQQLSISLSSLGTQSDFDLVSLDATDVAPEPGAIVLVTAGLLGLVVRRRFC